MIRPHQEKKKKGQLTTEKEGEEKKKSFFEKKGTYKPLLARDPACLKERGGERGKDLLLTDRRRRRPLRPGAYKRAICDPSWAENQPYYEHSL